MASRQRKDGGDFVLESRHLVGLFFLLVVIFGVVFTLGYLLGRRQYDSALHASGGKVVDNDLPVVSTKTKNKQPDQEETLSPQKNADWDFYHSAEPKTTEDHLQPPPKLVAAPKSPAAKPAPKPTQPFKVASGNASSTGKSGAPLNAPLIPKGTIMLQVAALQRQEDALALAQALQQKKFPAFVITPGPDKYYRVQVGPYIDNKAANAARLDLEAKGFKSIVKR